MAGGKMIDFVMALMPGGNDTTSVGDDEMLTDSPSAAQLLYLRIFDFERIRRRKDV